MQQKKVVPINRARFQKPISRRIKLPLAGCGSTKLQLPATRGPGAKSTRHIAHLMNSNLMAGKWIDRKPGPDMMLSKERKLLCICHPV
jgi:hypothetical protein